MRVMVSPDGSFPDPLGFRLLLAGPEGPLGDAGLDRLRGVSVAEVLPDIACGTAKGLLGPAKFPVKLCWSRVRSGVEYDCLNNFDPGCSFEGPSPPAAKTPAPGKWGA